MGKRLWVERNKDGSWDAFSDDGAHLKFGKGKGQFTPGDLMKIALAACAALCVGCYALAVFAPHPALGLAGCALCGFSVGIFWPGTFSMAAKALPAGGTAMYALMALAGDLGCSSGPGLVGLAAGAAGGELKTGILAAAVFPVLMLAGLAAMSRERKAG